MIFYYIIVSLLIIISAVLLEKIRSNWKYTSLVITILVFLAPPIYEHFKKDPVVPNFDARIYQYDLQQDSVFLKFEIENIGNIQARNIWYIASLEDNYSADNIKTIEKIEPNEKYTILSLCRLNADIKNWIKPALYVGFDYTNNGKTITVFKKFEFVITNAANSGSYSKVNSSDITKIASFDKLTDSLQIVSKKFSMKEGFFFIQFKPSDYELNTDIASGGKKRLFYNPLDSHVYFERPYDDPAMIAISKKIKNTNLDYHTASVTWNDTSTSLIVDSQNPISDKALRLQLDTNAAVIYRDLGVKYFNSKDYFNAVPMLEKSIDADSINHFITYQKLHISYDEIGLTYKAIEVLEKALRVGHNDSSTLINLALSYSRIKNYKKASDMYWLDHSKSSSLTGYLNHINLHNMLGNYGESLKIINQARSTYPNSSKLSNNTAITLVKLGDSSLALFYFKLAIELDPKNRNAKKNYKMLNAILEPASPPAPARFQTRE